MSLPRIEVDIRTTDKSGQTKAHADVRLSFPNGEISLIGFAVIVQGSKSPWVGFPQNAGKSKYFPVVEASGKIRKALVKAILDAYHDSEESK